MLSIMPWGRRAHMGRLIMVSRLLMLIFAAMQLAWRIQVQDLMVWDCLPVSAWNGDVTGTCTVDDVDSVMRFTTGSAGVFRNTVATDDEPGYYPQVYGTFVVADDEGNATEVNCTMYLLEDQTANFADCSDSDGNTVEQESDAVCVFE